MRIEHAGSASDPKERYAKITHDPGRIERFFVDELLRAHPEPPLALPSKPSAGPVGDRW